MAGTYAVTISLVDQATSKLDAINKRLAKLNQPAEKFNASLEKFAKLTGLDDVGKKLAGLARGAVDFARSLTSIITPLAAIGGAASLAGLYKLAEGFADLGVRLGLTSRQMGVSGVALQKLENVGRLANVPVAALDAGMQSLRDTMVDVVGGRAGDTAVMLNAVHISAADVALSIKDPIAALPVLAEKLRAIRDPTLQAKVATSLFGGAAMAMLPLLRASAQEFAALGGEVERHGLITLRGIEVSTALKHAMQGTAESVEGLAQSVLEKLSPSLTDLLTWLSKVIDANRADWAGWMGKKVAELAGWLESPAFSNVVAKIERIGGAMVSVAGFTVKYGATILEIFALFRGAQWAFSLARIADVALGWGKVETAAIAAKAAQAAAAGAAPAAAATGIAGVLARAAAIAMSIARVGSGAGAFAYTLYGGDAGPADEQKQLDDWYAKHPGMAPPPPGRAPNEDGPGGLNQRPILPGHMPFVPGFGGPSAPMAIPVQPAAATGVRAANEAQAFAFWTSPAGGSRTDAQAAGLVARMHLESGGDPANIGDGGEARNLYQHHQDRRDAIQKATGINLATDMNVGDVLTASQYELTHFERAANAKINATREPFAAGYAVSRDWIRPGLTESAKEMEARRTGQYAVDHLDQWRAGRDAALKAAVAVQAAPVAQGAAIPAGPTKSASEQTLDGSVTVTVRHANPPPGTTIQATTAGSLIAGPARIETPMPQMAGP